MVSAGGRNKRVRRLDKRDFLPMKGREVSRMQITVEVPDEIRAEASSRGLALIDFVESLIEKGFESERERKPLNDAIQRIRALRSSPAATAR